MKIIITLNLIAQLLLLKSCYSLNSDPRNLIMQNALKILVANISKDKFINCIEYKNNKINKIYYNFYTDSLLIQDISGSHTVDKDSLLTSINYLNKYKLINSKDSIETTLLKYEIILLNNYKEYENRSNLEGEVYLGIYRPLQIGDLYIVRGAIISKYSNYSADVYISFDKDGNFIRSSISQGIR